MVTDILNYKIKENILLFVANYKSKGSCNITKVSCVILFLCFFSPFSIAITSFGEERANLNAFRTFVRFALVWICRFPLPLSVWEGLRFVTVALPGLISYLFFQFAGSESPAQLQINVKKIERNKEHYGLENGSSVLLRLFISSNH